MYVSYPLCTHTHTHFSCVSSSPCSALIYRSSSDGYTFRQQQNKKKIKTTKMIIYLIMNNIENTSKLVAGLKPDVHNSSFCRTSRLNGIKLFMIIYYIAAISFFVPWTVNTEHRNEYIYFGQNDKNITLLANQKRSNDKAQCHMSFEFVICTNAFLKCGNKVALGIAWSVEHRSAIWFKFNNWHYYRRTQAKQRIQFGIQMNECRKYLDRRLCILRD